MEARRILRLKHDRIDLGFLSASLAMEEMGRGPNWTLRVKSPASAEEFRDHLCEGSCMDLSMTTRDGTQLRGEAYVSSISDGVESATVVVLAGTGPLRRT